MLQSDVLHRPVFENNLNLFVMFISHYSGKMNSDMLDRNKTQLKLGLHRLIIIAVIKHRKETECITRTDEKKKKIIYV